MEEQRFRKSLTGVRFSRAAHKNMSRLKTYEQKQFRKKLVLYIGAIIIILFLLFSFGIKFIINTSLFVSGLSSNKNNQQPLKKNNDFYGLLNIDDIPSATNSAKIIVSGSSTGFEILEFYINNSKVRELNTLSNSFAEEIGDLKLGQNEVYLKAKTKDGKKTKETQKFEVLYNNQKPKLDISEPVSPFKTSKQDIKIAGSTDKEVYIKINDLPVVVNSEGNFLTNISLKEGDNAVVIVASDNAGNTETKTLTISYQKD